jgi:glycosyltransferase involved in cell wall biosynthesis
MSELAPLNILMTADAVGGVWQYATELAGELGRDGHNVSLALLGPPPTAAQRERCEALAGVKLIETGLPLDWLSSGPGPVRTAAEEIARLAMASRADIVHCNMPSLAGAADFGVPVLAVAHGCVATWWPASRHGPLPEEFRWHRDLTRRGLLAAQTVVAPSASHARIVQRTYELPTLPVAVHNGRGLLTGELGESPAIRSALTVGRLWDAAKNVAALDEAARLLEAPFLAVGPLRGPNGEQFSPHHLNAVGRLETGELAMLLRLRPVFASAAMFEPFGLAVLEGAQAGCPLVLSDIATFRELWDGAAVFISPSDATGFAEAIACLLGDAPRARALGQAASERARRYTPRATACQMETIYNGLLAEAEVAA